MLINRLNLAGNDKQTYDDFKILNVLDLVHVDLVQVDIELIEFSLNDLINQGNFSSQKFDIVMG